MSRITTSTRKTSSARSEIAAPKLQRNAKVVGSQSTTHTMGTQSISRAVTMLREIAGFKKGMRLVDIAAAMGLERPTAHRIVKGLLMQGMVMQDPVTKAYRLGHVVYELGLAASPAYNVKEVCQSTLQRLAERTADSVYLIVRSGTDAVCLDFVEGSYPIRTRTLEIGMRRPLGVGAGSLALMLHLSDPEIDRIIAVNEPRIQAFSLLDGERLREAIARSRKAGFAINHEDVLPGVSGIGASILTRGGQPFSAISIAGIASRFTEGRREELAQMLLKETRTLARKLDELSVTWR